MHRIHPSFSGLAWLALCLSVIGCGGGGGTKETSGVAVEEDFSAVLGNVVDVVIIKTYEDLHERAARLHECTALLEEDATDEQLKLCQKAWVAARVPWEQSEGFLFGPVSTEGLDPAMDSWPVDHQQLDALMASDVDLSADMITANLGGGLKGFHTIEFLLWGMDHERTAEDLRKNPRQAAYLSELTLALSRDTEQLTQSWRGDALEPGFGAKFAASGKAGGLYSSQLDAVQELLGGMVAICDEVAFGKIAEPSKARDPNLIESQFSYNSLLDFADNIRSVQNVYLGSLDASIGEKSLSKVVASYDAELDARVQAQLQTAIDAIIAIGDGDVTFRDAILDPAKDAAIESSQTEIAELMNLLSGEVLPMFSR